MRRRLGIAIVQVKDSCSGLDAETKAPIEGVAPAAMAHLRRAAWPGHVRQIENVVRSAAALRTTTRLTPQDLPQRLREPPEAPPGGRLAEAVERAALAGERGHRTRTAACLGITRKTLLAWIVAHGLEEENEG